MQDLRLLIRIHSGIVSYHSLTETRDHFFTGLSDVENYLLKLINYKLKLNSRWTIITAIILGVLAIGLIAGFLSAPNTIFLNFALLISGLSFLIGIPLSGVAYYSLKVSKTNSLFYELDSTVADAYQTLGKIFLKLLKPIKGWNVEVLNPQAVSYADPVNYDVHKSQRIACDTSSTVYWVGKHHKVPLILSGKRQLHFLPDRLIYTTSKLSIPISAIASITYSSLEVSLVESSSELSTIKMVSKSGFTCTVDVANLELAKQVEQTLLRLIKATLPVKDS